MIFKKYQSKVIYSVTTIQKKRVGNKQSLILISNEDWVQYEASSENSDKLNGEAFEEKDAGHDHITNITNI